MNDEELNKRIHEWMGGHVCSDYKETVIIGGLCEHSHWKCGKCGDGNFCLEEPYSLNVNYCQDHTAVQGFLRIASGRPDVECTIGVADALVTAVTKHDNEFNIWKTDTSGEEIASIVAWRVALLSPRQLAEAGAKAVGIWEGK